MYQILKCSNKRLLAGCALMLGLWNGLLAQSDSSTARVEKGIFKFYFITPSVGYEYGLSKKNTLYAETALNFGANVSWPDSGDLRVFPLLFPTVRAEVRHFYNLEKRQAKGKRWRGNTGPFFGGVIQQSLNPVWERSTGNAEITSAYNPTTTVGVMWGYQHTDPKLANLHFTFAIGPSIAFSRNTIGRGLGAGYLKLGFAFGDFDEKQKK
jgi:hypothetical protein